MTQSKTDTITWLREHWIELLLAFALLAILTVSPSSVRAKEADLPTGDEIFKLYVKATGGEKAHDKLNNRITTASLELAAQGIKLSMTIHSARPNSNYTVVESEFTGKIEKGTDGNTVWEISDMMGPQIKEGSERTDFLREAYFDRFTDWNELYSDAKVLGVETIDDSPAYKLLLTPIAGRQQTMYFDTASNLLVKHEFVIDNAMGSIPVVSHVGDYRKVDGILMPFTIRAIVMDQERTLIMETIEHNVDQPADRFGLPQKIQALVGD